jgi:hypothetical protein
MSNNRAPKDAKPDEEHLAWAIDQRADVQHTLLALYGFVRHRQPACLDEELIAGYWLWKVA